MRAALIIATALALAAACGSSGGGGGGGGGSNTVPDSAQSTCGKPGDMGNELGVGQYCQALSDCTGSANLCSDLGDATTHFCTMICKQAGSAGQCGTNAMCECQGGQCGCTPDSCLM